MLLAKTKRTTSSSKVLETYKSINFFSFGMQLNSAVALQGLAVSGFENVKAVRKDSKNIKEPIFLIFFWEFLRGENFIQFFKIKSKT